MENTGQQVSPQHINGTLPRTVRSIEAGVGSTSGQQGHLQGKIEKYLQLALLAVYASQESSLASAGLHNQMLSIMAGAHTNSYLD